MLNKSGTGILIVFAGDVNISNEQYFYINDHFGKRMEQGKASDDNFFENYRVQI